MSATSPTLTSGLRLLIAAAVFTAATCPSTAQTRLEIRGVATLTVPDWTYDGPYDFVRPGDRLAGGYGYGVGVAAEWDLAPRLTVGADLDYRLSRFVELPAFPRRKPTRAYGFHRAALRPRLAFWPIPSVGVELGYVASLRLNDPAEAVLEDYRGLRREELLLLPDFNDPIGAMGVYMTGSGFRSGPSASIAARYRQWTGTFRFDYLVQDVGERSLREVDTSTGGTLPLQTSRWRYGEWSIGVGYRIGAREP